MALVVSILKGETSVAEAARQHGLTVAEVKDWSATFLLGAENAIRSRPKDEDAVKNEQIKKLKQDRRSGFRSRYFTGDLETVPFGPDDIRRVSGTVSGVSERRSCQVLGVSRAGLHRTAASKLRRLVANPPWTERLRQLIQQHPTFGYRRLWVLVRFWDADCASIGRSSIVC